MSRFENWDKLEDEDDEALEDYSWLQGGKDAVLFAVECSESMLRQRPVEGTKVKKSYIQTALEGCRDFMKRKVTVGPNDSVGIMLYNTAEKHDSRGEKSGEIKDYCHVLQLVERISAPKVLQLSELLDTFSENPDEIESMFTPKPGPHAPLGDVFTSCNWLLRDKSARLGIKRLFIITDNDDPHPDNAQLRMTARNTMSDLRQLGVIIQSFFISSDDRPFDKSKFWEGVLADSNSEYSEIIDDVVVSFEAILSEMRFRETAKHSLWSVPFHLAKGFTIGVKGYGLVTEQKKPSFFYRSNLGREQEEALKKTTYVDEDLEMEVDKSEIVYGMSLGVGKDGEEEGFTRVANPRSKVFYTAEEVKELRTMGMQPQIKLLGFKDLDQLATEDNVKHSMFMYPDEKAYSGSTRTFSALLKVMKAKNKIALVLGLLRRNSSPAFYALLPQEENPIEREPAGFHLIQLPFADDLRVAPYSDAIRPQEAAVEAATAWIERLKVKNGSYNPDDNPNPALQYHYAQLEALAFNEEIEPVEDLTEPPTDIMKKRAGHLISAWNKIVKEDQSSHVWTGEGAAKRRPDINVDEAEFRARWEGGTLNKFRVDQMKEFLKSKRLNISGKKDELQSRISDWLEKKS
ncbi:Ku DNA-binding complex, Ku70 subunit [Sistotremastrum suecicum HHB10207 ss-3]|uniref:ATP-dependent DNA helicase II subunit 1 n=1 Tax=Sistotremastrum suecicum HHB10207 ss-3 TaxID=1314776 RepID=A0A166FB46_9AGAM|nr:Ku DNA-binding complex, Ku70 subunit [Sistotremastrum suecicum HHB10207 ss-3]